MPDLQELHRTNEPKAEQICATRLGYTAQAIYMLGPAALDLTTLLYSAGTYSEESRINNISVKSCEKHSNSVKATDIRTNATDVETRRNIVQ